MSDERFSGLVLDTFVRVEASPPDPPPAFRGLLIAAPTLVHLGAPDPRFPSRRSVIIPIAGRYVVDVRRRPGIRELTDAMVAHARDLRWGIERSGALIPPPSLDGVPRIETPLPPPPPEEELRGIVVGGFFNIDLTRYVNIPDDEGIHEIWLELDEQPSGTAIIELRFEPSLFDLVRLPSMTASVCSPRVPFADFRGLLVRAPRMVFVRETEIPRVPLCGLFVPEEDRAPAPLRISASEASMDIEHHGGYFNVDAGPLIGASAPASLEIVVEAGGWTERLPIALELLPPTR